MAKTIDLKTRYTTEIIPELKKKLGINNPMSVPKVVKISVNAGIGTYVKGGNKDYSHIVDAIKMITGQQPVLRKAKKAISNFKIKQNEVIGISTTVRGKRMYDLLNKLINVVFPRVRDFRGISKKAFDGKGNYTVGLKEHTVFPEISADDISKIHGLQLTICTNAKTNENALALLEAMGFPFKK